MDFAALSALLLLAAAVAGAYLLRRRRGQGGRDSHSVRWVSGLQLGPQHRVVVIEVGPPQARQQLALGLAAGAITPLHRWTLTDPEASPHE